MSDRTGARAMAEVFVILDNAAATGAVPRHTIIPMAQTVWMKAFRWVDCSWQQLGIDDTLERLDLITVKNRGTDDEEWIPWDEGP